MRPAADRMGDSSARIKAWPARMPARKGAHAARRARCMEYPSRCMVPGAGDGCRIEVGRCHASRHVPAWSARRHGREPGMATGHAPRSMHLDAGNPPCRPPATRNGRVRPPLAAPSRSPQEDAGFSPNVLVVWWYCHCFVWLLPYLSYKRPFDGQERRRLYAKLVPSASNESPSSTY